MFDEILIYTTEKNIYIYIYIAPTVILKRIYLGNVI